MKDQIKVLDKFNKWCPYISDTFAAAARDGFIEGAKTSQADVDALIKGLKELIAVAPNGHGSTYTRLAVGNTETVKRIEYLIAGHEKND